MSAVQTPIFLFMAYEYSLDFQQQSWRPQVWHCKVDDHETRIFLKEQLITVEIPDDFNPTPMQVSAIEKQKVEALARYTAQLAELNERLHKLMAISA